MAGDRVAVLMMAYGGPASLDDVEPYLQDVRGGRPTSPQLVQEIRQRYAKIGGRSPILELTRAQAAAVERALGDGFSAYVGMRHWHPYIRETVDDIVRAGHRRLVGIVMAPHYSSMSVGAYEKRMLEAVQGRLETALAGRRGLASWHVAYQSAGATAEPWLGPDAGELISDLAARGRDAFLLVPIGFVCDHVEILYDIDVKYRALADALGARLERTASLNDDPDLAAALADVARAAARQRGWR